MSRLSTWGVVRMESMLVIGKRERLVIDQSCRWSRSALSQILTRIGHLFSHGKLFHNDSWRCSIAPELPKILVTIHSTKGEQTCQSNLVLNQLQNQRANQINVGATIRKPQKIRLTSSLTNTKRVINCGGGHVNEVPLNNSFNSAPFSSAA